MGINFGIWEPQRATFEESSSEVLGKVDLDKLDESQRAAVTDESPRVVIEAPSGSGKTNCLINAVCYYRSKHPHDFISAITYTRAARDEMIKRFEEKGINNIFVSTVHGWAHRQLDDLSRKYGFNINILQESEIHKIIHDLVEENFPSMMKYENAFYFFCMVSKLMDVTDGFKRKLQSISDEYEYYKVANGLYDYNDYPRYLNDMLHKYDEYLTETDALFVDEYQDIDPDQKEIFDRCLTNKKFFIGDPWQSIYIFRGADGSAFEDLVNFKRYKLKFNYRTYQPIIDYASFVYKNNKDLMCNRGIPYCKIRCKKGAEGGQLSLWYSDDSYLKFNPTLGRFYLTRGQAVKDVEELLDSKCQILVRSNKQVKAVQEYYPYVTTVHQAKGLEYPYVIVPNMVTDDYEEKNIGYVALTRAKEKLMVCDWNKLISAVYSWRRSNNRNKFDLQTTEKLSIFGYIYYNKS